MILGMIQCDSWGRQTWGPLSPVYSDTTQLNSTRHRVELSWVELCRYKRGFKGGSGECCKFPQRGRGRSPNGNRIWCILALKSDIRWQQFYKFFWESINHSVCIFPNCVFDNFFPLGACTHRSTMLLTVHKVQFDVKCENRRKYRVKESPESEGGR